MGVLNRIMAAIKAFKEELTMSGEADINGLGDFGTWEARRLRYEMSWAFYENNVYRNIHTWAPRMKADYGLYKHTRNIYNPTYRIVSFYRQHIYGGALDMAAGDGSAIPSAIPITTENDDLRLAISRLWKDSNWESEKSILAQWGACFGDVLLRVIDDTSRQKVQLKTVHPATIKSLTLDAVNNVRGYEIEYKRVDEKGIEFDYSEIVERDGEDVVYTTRKNGHLFAYPENAANNVPVAQWREPYGFVPLVLIRHNHVGLDWGWAETHPALSKFREVDDVASKVSDQIRKMVDSPWLFSGVQKPTTAATTRGRTATIDNPDPSREEVPVIYANDPNAKAQALVSPLDIASALQHVGNMLAELEREFPELQMDIWNSGGDTSGRALRLARQRVTQKVIDRRAGYDSGLTRAMQMAVSIGGYRKYDGYAGFDLDSFKRGDMEMSIASRPVFEVDKFEKLEESKLFWETASTAIKAGMPLLVYLKNEGWSDEKIGAITKSAEYMSRLALLSDMGGNQGA